MWLMQLKKRKAYYEGKAIHFHEYSEHRIEPICEHLVFVVVNGKYEYSQQLYYKQTKY
jgi:23S rRNA (uracil1939-C5)-methyltransferase